MIASCKHDTQAVEQLFDGIIYGKFTYQLCEYIKSLMKSPVVNLNSVFEIVARQIHVSLNYDKNYT